MMKIYLVGGAVRDLLLGLEPKELDWVVVGATPDELMHQGYKPVGKDFPVFLHPDTHEEYALARTERKTAPGYAGFAFNASPEVTREEDLMRRDLTINAIAQDADGGLIDPYNGQRDLENRTLRHVSNAFVEDPVRILRIARFAARFAYLGFVVADETHQLMKQMVESGEVDALVPERVWKECEKALGEANPEVFLQVLESCGALSRLCPELLDLNAIGQAMQAAVHLSNHSTIRFAAMLVAEPDMTMNKLQAICKRWRVPKAYAELAGLTLRFGKRAMQLDSLDAQGLLDILMGADALRREARFDQMLLASCASCAVAQSIGHEQGGEVIALFAKALEAIKSVDVKPLLAQGLKGVALAQALSGERLAKLQNLFL